MATRINIVSIKQVRESSILYEGSKHISSPSNVFDILRTLDLHNEAVEKFGVLALDTKNKVVGINIVSVGTLDSSLVHPRSIFQFALLSNASRIILFHNHPSGDTKQSEEDLLMTKRLIDAGKIMGVNVVDHIIIGDGQFLSFREAGLM